MLWTRYAIMLRIQLIIRSIAGTDVKCMIYTVLWLPSNDLCHTATSQSILSTLTHLYTAKWRRKKSATQNKYNMKAICFELSNVTMYNLGLIVKQTQCQSRMQILHEKIFRSNIILLVHLTRRGKPVDLISRVQWIFQGNSLFTIMYVHVYLCIPQKKKKNNNSWLKNR